MNNDPIESFRQECLERVRAYPDSPIDMAARNFMRESTVPKYSYNFTWMTRPIIQYPQDIVAIQEIIWQVKPDLIIETGIAHGGSLIFSASMLGLIDYCDAMERGVTLDPGLSHRKVLGIDIDIRPHNRAAIEAHPMARHIEMIQGSSIAQEVIDQVRGIAKNYQRVLVCLDSNHTHDHVLAELEAYAPLASVGSYCVVFDTVIEEFPDGMYPDRPWGKGNNPKTAVFEFLGKLKNKSYSDARMSTLRFEIDRDIQSKLLVTVAPDGYLKRTA